MYEGVYCNRCAELPYQQPSQQFNFDTQSFFGNPKDLEYKANSFNPIYRMMSYISMLDFGILRPIYLGVSALEKYLTKNMLRMQVDSEYLINSSIEYKLAKGDYTTQFNTGSVIHEPELFLVPGRPMTEFVEEITPAFRKKIELIFKLTTGNNLPEKILLSILNEVDLEREHSKHSKSWSRDIQGFALNRKHMDDFSNVFVKENPLDMLILTIGHEIGHCLSTAKNDILLEEAKAFAFELAWMKIIHKFDIMGLRKNMNLNILNPTANGVHNVALNFVKSQLNFNREPMDVFKKIIKDEVKI
jgi:hypothetical protein